MILQGTRKIIKWKKNLWKDPYRMYYNFHNQNFCYSVNIAPDLKNYLGFEHSSVYFLKSMIIISFVSVKTKTKTKPQ